MRSVWWWTGSYTPEERESYKEIIYSNTVQSMHVILDAMDMMGIDFGAQGADRDRMRERANVIMGLPHQIEGEALDGEVTDAIKGLWADEGVRRCFKRSREFQCVLSLLTSSVYPVDTGRTGSTTRRNTTLTRSTGSVLPTTSPTTKTSSGPGSRRRASPRRSSSSATSSTACSTSEGRGASGKSGSIASRTSRPSSSWSRFRSTIRCSTRTSRWCAHLLPYCISRHEADLAST